tara:strand:- start:645 stop:1073 length:429 start_codon:yes stop_codon:yes gene_type:complete
MFDQNFDIRLVDFGTAKEIALEEMGVKLGDSSKQKLENGVEEYYETSSEEEHNEEVNSDGISGCSECNDALRAGMRSSFVGTAAYLPPEIVLSQRYHLNSHVLSTPWSVSFMLVYFKFVLFWFYQLTCTANCFGLCHLCQFI